MSPRSLPTSRAYWELRAEQVMDRVFTPAGAVDTDVAAANDDPDSPIDVLVRDEGPSATPPPGAAPRPAGRSLRQRGRLHRWPSGWTLGGTPSARTRQVVALSGAVCVAMGGLSLLFWRNWTVARQDLRQERNLLLLERLRALGPAAEASKDLATTAVTGKGGPTSDAAQGEQADANALPPPPSEAWMEELASLPQSSAPPAEVLRVPMNSSISRPAPPAARSGGSGTGGGGGGGSSSASGGGGALPQLVGVVQVPGRPGSAIFQMDGSSSSAVVGESIGGSGWRLRSASGDTAVIERGGEQRQVSISSGF